ncbi:MAG: tetratricopeptide repeat protein [Bacteroidia bacterium]
MSFCKRWSVVWISFLWAQRPAFSYALLDLDYVAATHQLEYEYDIGFQLFFQHKIAFSQGIFTSKASAYEDFSQVSEVLIQRVKNRAHPLKSAFLAHMYAQRAIVQAWYGKWLTAAVSAWQALQALKDAPADPLKYQLEGLSILLFSTLPKTYKPFFKKIMPTGSVPQGLHKLRRSIVMGHYLAWESSLWYYHALKNLDTLSSAWADTVHTSMGQGPYLWRFSYALGLLDEGKLTQATESLKILVRTPRAGFPYPYYWLGRAYWLLGERDSAFHSWDVYVARQFFRFGITAQYGFRAFSYFLAGDSLRGRYWAQACMRHPPAFWEEDKALYALCQRWLIRAPSKVELRLLMARWLIDAGAYRAALDTLEPLRMELVRLPTYQKGELYYRYARAYHKMGAWENALFAYYQAYKYDAPDGMRGWAAYYIGLLSEKRQDWANARRYYLEAQKDPTGPYAESLMQKAQAGFARVRDKKYPASDGSP